MNNMRRGFTLIELIFVIVIIGILAAVALPRFLETADAAHVSKMKAYAGTLSRTTLPPFWNKSIEADLNGSIVTYDLQIEAALNHPDEVDTYSGFASLVHTAPLFTEPESLNAAATVAVANIGGVTYTVQCLDGNKTTAPKCNVYNGTTNKWIVKY